MFLTNNQNNFFFVIFQSFLLLFIFYFIILFIIFQFFYCFPVLIGIFQAAFPLQPGSILRFICIAYTQRQSVQRTEIQHTSKAISF